MMNELSVSQLYDETLEKRRRIAAWQSGDDSITTVELHDLVHEVAINDESLRRVLDFRSSLDAKAHARSKPRGRARPHLLLDTRAGTPSRAAFAGAFRLPLPIFGR